MAIERKSATQQVAVERAQRIEPVRTPFIDPSDFRLSTAGAEGLKVVGNVLAELGKRKQEAQDSLSINRAGELRDTTKLRIQQLLTQEGDATKWDSIARKEIGKLEKELARQSMSAQVRKQQQVEQEGFRERTLIGVELHATEKTIDDDIKFGAIRLDQAIVNDDGSIESADEIDRLLKSQKEALGRQYDDEDAETFLEQTVQKAQDGKIEKIKKDIMNLAAVNPVDVKTAVNAELKSRAKGKRVDPDFALLENSQLELIRDYANSIGEKAVTDSEISLNASLVDSYGQIRDGNTDIDAMIDAVDSDPTISDEDKIKFAEKVPSYFNKINSTKVADESDEDIYDELVQAIESVERGSLSPAAFEEMYADKKEFLDKDDQRLIRDKDIVATKTMQNRTFSDAIASNRATFVELAADELSSIKLARRNAELVRDIPKINIFNIALKKNQAQRWNFGRFRKQLRSQISQNPEWSQKQIFTAEEVLIEQLDVTEDKLLRDFDAKNPQRAILKTPPDIIFKDIWADLSQESRSLIWSERMAGTPARVLFEDEDVQEVIEEEGEID